jgi:hypothetical protein
LPTKSALSFVPRFFEQRERVDEARQTLVVHHAADEAHVLFRRERALRARGTRRDRCRATAARGFWYSARPSAQQLRHLERLTTRNATARLVAQRTYACATLRSKRSLRSAATGWPGT